MCIRLELVACMKCLIFLTACVLFGIYLWHQNNLLNYNRRSGTFLYNIVSR
jgi:hypothetical protein